VKGGELPAKHIRKFGIQLADNCDVRNCVVDSVFDGILSENTHDSRIHHSMFSHIWDDMYQIFSSHYNIEIDHNFVYGAGPSHDHTGGPGPAPGTKYIHHNVIDNTAFEMMWTRHDPHVLAEQRYQGWQHPVPLSRHGVPVVEIRPGVLLEFRDPWKFYNNTVIIGLNLPSGEVGFGRWGTASDPASPSHDVYNNIFIIDFDQMWVQYLTSNLASEIYDGNVYYAVPPAVPFWNRVRTSADQQGQDIPTTTLAALKALVTTDSQNFYAPGFESSGIDGNPQLDANYRPSISGPAATGAVDLSATGFPGVTSDVWRGALAPRGAKGDRQMAEQIRTASGKLSFLRVHRLGSGFGPSSDFIDVELVIGIQGAKGGFGATLRNDNNRFAHQGMLDLLRDVFNSDTSVEVEYTVDPGEFGKLNGTILRVTRRK
jgi:hypothetical protein